MKLIKDVIVRGSDGKEINKTDVGKARRLLKSGSAKLIQRTPLIKWEPHTRDFSRELGDQTSQRI